MAPLRLPMLGLWIDVPYVFLLPSILDTLCQSLYGKSFKSDKKCESSRKRVTFSNIVRVMLIPTRNELRLARLALWHTPYDYLLAKRSVKEEVGEILQNSSFSSRECMRILYQPRSSCIKVLVIEKDRKVRDWIRDQIYYSMGDPNVLLVFVESGLQAISKARKILCFDVVMMRSNLPCSYFDVRQEHLPKLLRKASGFDSCLFVSLPSSISSMMSCQLGCHQSVESSEREEGGFTEGWQDISRLLELFHSRSGVESTSTGAH